MWPLGLASLTERDVFKIKSHCREYLNFLFLAYLNFLPFFWLRFPSILLCGWSTSAWTALG